MLRKIMAVVLGYAVIGLLAVALDGVATVLVKTFAQGKGPLFIMSVSNLVAAGLAGIGGGYVAGAVARHRIVANILAVMVFLGGLAYAVAQQRAGLPAWYPLGLPVLGAIGTFLGGWIRGEA